MAVDKFVKQGRAPVSIWNKLNPVWWLHGPDGWDVPEYNNVDPATGLPMPYLPDVKNMLVRRFYWFICRNPLMNFVGYVLGVEDKNYVATGSAPVERTTGRDCSPQQIGFRWAYLMFPFSPAALIITIVLAALAWFVSALFWWLVPFAALRIVGPLPYISYWGPVIGTSRKLEFYLGWRPHSGGFGLKIVFPEYDASQM